MDFFNSFKKKVLFVGIPDMAYICLDGLVAAGVNIVGVVGPKKDHPTYFVFKNFVELRKLNYIEYDELDNPDFIQNIRNLNPDIAVVCSFNYKIPKDLLNSTKDGFVNIHPSLLPKYRGPNPYSAVIINEEKETGVTIHFMNESFDKGDIIAQRTLQVSPYETMGTLFNRTNLIGLDMLLQVLRGYENNDLPRLKQPEGEFERGISLTEKDLTIDYNNPAVHIQRQIRAANPFFLSKTNFRGTLVRVLSSEIDKSEYPPDTENGTIVKTDDEKFYIATKDGLLAPTALQFGSFFAGTSKDFIKILNPTVGEKFE